MYEDGQNNNVNNGYENNAYTDNSNANGYTNGDGNGNYNNNYNSNFDNNYESKKKKKANLKVVGAICGMLAVTVTSGVIGGVVTYNFVGNNGTNTITTTSSSDYVAPEFASSDDGSLTISEAYEKVKDAVVTISTTSIQQVSGSFGQSYSQEVEGLGSGFIISEDGYILTNYHVVEGSTNVSVLLSTGDEVSAKVVNYDSDMDLAVIKLEDGVDVPGVAELGDSDALYPGEDVIAIGTPLSKTFASTLTKGIVSAVNREVESESGTTLNVIQTDAAINAGNSGGPLVNTQGQVIGINSMKMGSSSSSESTASIEGMGFAIPINEAKERIDSLTKPLLTLGVSVIEIGEDEAKQYDLPQGLYVKSVTDGSPAAEAGIQSGDVIVKFDGTDITTYDELNALKAEKNAGDTVSVVVSRSGKEVEVQVTLAES